MIALIVHRYCCSRLSVDVLFAIGVCDGESNMKRERIFETSRNDVSSIMRAILPSNDDTRQQMDHEYIDAHAKKNKQRIDTRNGVLAR